MQDPDFWCTSTPWWAGRPRLRGELAALLHRCCCAQVLDLHCRSPACVRADGASQAQPALSGAAPERHARRHAAVHHWHHQRFDKERESKRGSRWGISDRILTDDR